MFKGTIVNDVNSGVMYLDSVQEYDDDTRNQNINGNTDKNYIAFDLFIKLDYKATEQAPTQPVYFTSGTGITTYGAANTYIEYAGRMGFVVNGNLPSSSSVDQLRNIKDLAASNNYLDIF